MQLIVSRLLFSIGYWLETGVCSGKLLNDTSWIIDSNRSFAVDKALFFLYVDGITTI
jgi:hypothetical protein